MAQRQIAGQATGDSLIVDTESAQQLDEIRSIWSDLRSALEDGNYTRYGELLNDLNELINDQ
jgi:hypothetical protein